MKLEDGIATLTHEEWEAAGIERYGKERLDWKVICPLCEHVQSVEDFRQYKDKGATPNSPFTQCIGRFSLDSKPAFGDKPIKGNGPCDYAAYGLLRLAPLRVVFDDHEGATHCFDFADRPLAGAE